MIPLQAALDRLVRRTRSEVEARAIADTIAQTTPSDVAVRAAEARLAALPKALPGAMLLALGWAAPSGALAGLALGPSVTASVAGSGYALFAAAGSATFLGFAGLARLWSAARTRLLRGSLAAARADFEAACATIERAHQEALGPEIARAALTWFRERMLTERRRLSAVEAQVRSLGRSIDAELSEPVPGMREIDVAVDLSAAKRLLDPAPEPLVQRVRSEIAGGWRESLPTLLDLGGAAHGIAAKGARGAPWTERSDIAKALVEPLGRALAAVERGLERLVPRGLPVRRVAILPAPFEAAEVGVQGGPVLPGAGDAHLLVLWRSA